jgi:4-amino-4-deoxy-L-arabinose transferase-like glycosyltransferase
MLRTWFPILVALLYLMLCTPLLRLAAVGGSSEAREVHVIRTIVTTDEWILPTRNGLVPSKPPLFHWIAASTAELLNRPVTPGLVRGVSAAAAALMVAITVLMGMRALACQSPHLNDSQLTLGGLGAAAILTLTYGFVNLVCDARVDMLFSAFVVAAVWMLIRPTLQSPVRDIKQRDTFFFYALCGAATLTKGPLGIVLPLLTAGGYLLSLRGWRSTLRLFMQPCLGWVAFFIIVAPWYVLAMAHGKEGFVGRQLVFENLKRFLGGESINSEAWWFYLPSFVRIAAPFSLLALLFIPRIVRSFTGVSLIISAEMDSRRRIKGLFGVWFLVGVIFFSFASGKRHSYLLPLFPALSVCLMLCIEEFLRERSQAIGSITRRALEWCGEKVMWVLVAVLLLFVASGLPWQVSAIRVQVAQVFFSRYGEALAMQLVVPLVFALLIARLFPTLLSRWLGRWLCAVAGMLILVQLGLALKAHFKGFQGMAQSIAQTVGTDALTVIRGEKEEYFDPILWYLDRSVVLQPRLDLQNLPEKSWVLVQSSDLPAELGAQIKLFTVRERLRYYTNDARADVVLFYWEGGEVIPDPSAQPFEPRSGLPPVRPERSAPERGGYGLRQT